MRTIVPAIALACITSAPVCAQETRVMPADHISPAASMDDMDWLVGQWEGTGIGGNRATESWLPPTGDTMVGTFIQTGGNGGIQFTEHLYLVEHVGSLVLRLKHFNPDLTGWEERDDMLTFRLVDIEPCAAYFASLTLRCDGDDGLVAAVQIRSKDGAANELIFRFRRTGEPLVPSRCSDAVTTLDINDCLLAVFERADARRGEYLAAAIQQADGNAELTAQIEQSDAAFTAYRDAECGAVYTDWIEGSIRGAMSLSCRIAMTDRRTSTIWQNWLTQMDSTTPILPEPAPTR